jgi:Asp-tRNA(Asn)/Glu-tRNA(Gln) amidotransferase A subunit family amidase
MITNLTGHPTVVMPNGLRKQRDSEVETPISITFTGQLFGETDLLTLAKAYQDATGHHLKRPPMNV